MGIVIGIELDSIDDNRIERRIRLDPIREDFRIRLEKIRLDLYR